METKKLINQQFLDILTVVAMNPGIKHSDIMIKLDNKRAIASKIHELVELNMIKETKHGLHNMKTYLISDYGQSVLDAMIKLQKTINKEEVSSDDYVVSSESNIQDLKE